MKRLFILASAAIIAFASCAKTHVVYNEEPQEISFRAINMPMTKTTTSYNQSLGVYAYNITKENFYFEKTLFTLSDGAWTGGMYWPLTDALGFIAYGPGIDCVESITVTTSNIVATGVKSDVDFVYSNAFADNSSMGYTKDNVPDGGVPITLSHAKSKIVINLIVEGANETVTETLLKSVGQIGTCNITLGNSPVWTTTTEGNYSFDTSNTTHYVIPGTPTSIQITYNTQSPEATGLTHTIDLSQVEMKDSELNEISDWKPGYSYTYNVTITSKEIKINASVESWVDTTGSVDL